MEITTAFNPGDKVWVMKNDKPYQFKISRIEITIKPPSRSREIYVDHIPGATMMDRDQEYEYPFYSCFATKQDLLNSFLSEGD